MKKKKLLYISCMVPYDRVDHAGGQVHNFYIKTLQKSQKYDITLLSMGWQREVEFFDLEKYGINNSIYILDKNRLHSLKRKLISGFSYFNPFDKYGNLFLDYELFHFKNLICNFAKDVLKGIQKTPEIIILQWTQTIFLIDYVKHFFPNAKIIAVEEDVSYLNFERRIDLAPSFFAKKIAAWRYRNLKKMELKCLKKADIIVNNNRKDLLFLQKEQIFNDKLYELPVFFKSYKYVQRNEIDNSILFYGAMSRPENYMSALWFIDNVMPFLEKDKIQFIVVGSRPPEQLIKRQSKNIKIRGYVLDITEYFSKCLCFVAPLKLGAGVKVKVLEAMSSGIPVLTNNIGIEGIPAVNNEHYYHCESANEYVDKIKNILLNKGSNERAKDFIEQNYNLPKAFEAFMNNVL